MLDCSHSEARESQNRLAGIFSVREMLAGTRETFSLSSDTRENVFIWLMLNLLKIIRRLTIVEKVIFKPMRLERSQKRKGKTKYHFLDDHFIQFGKLIYNPKSK